MFATGPRAVSADGQDLFAVEVEAGTTCRFDLEGRDTGSGSLRDPVLRGILDSSGTRVDDTWDDGGGGGYNASHLDQNVLGQLAAVAPASILGLSGDLFSAATRSPVSTRPLFGANVALENRDQRRKPKMRPVQPF